MLSNKKMHDHDKWQKNYANNKNAETQKSTIMLKITIMLNAKKPHCMCQKKQKKNITKHCQPACTPNKQTKKKQLHAKKIKKKSSAMVKW